MYLGLGDQMEGYKLITRVKGSVILDDIELESSAITYILAGE